MGYRSFSVSLRATAQLTVIPGIGFRQSLVALSSLFLEVNFLIQLVTSFEMELYFVV